MQDLTRTIPVVEGCPPPAVAPGPAATPAAALEPGLACAAAPDLIEAPPHLPEESSLQPALVPATEKELPLENSPRPVLELIVIQSALPLPPEVVLPTV